MKIQDAMKIDIRTLSSANVQIIFLTITTIIQLGAWIYTNAEIMMSQEHSNKNITTELQVYNEAYCSM